MRTCATVVYLLFLFSLSADSQLLFESEFIFDPMVESHGHVHASCIVECPNGDLLAAWYENGPRLASYEYTKEADKSDDVRIGGARRRLHARAWEKPFALSDTFGVSDNNPALAIDKQKRLWLIHGTLLAVPQLSWGSSLLWYKVSSDYDKPGPPKWDRENLLIVRPRGFEEIFEKLSQRNEDKGSQQHFRDLFLRRLGWMPRAHPLVMENGTVLVPLGNENFNVAAMALTYDSGETWTFSNVVPGANISQPSVVELASGRLVAFFRDEGATRRIKRSESRDGGLTWSKVIPTTLPNPGSGIEAVVLRNGHLAIVYNDQEKAPRDRLAISVSLDEGRTWKWTRHLENRPGGRFDYSSVIQASDGAIHVTYSYNVQTIKHVRFNEEWVQQGE